MIGLGGAALGSWWAADQLSGSRALSPRRASGSRLEGLFSGNRFPVTHTTSASKEQVDPASWRLTVAEAAASPRDYTYAELLTLPSVDLTASLDCTLGWYTTQSWRGARLSDLLSPAGPAPNTFGVRLESVTGYALILPWREAQEALLATHVGGETLAFEHGFPIRVVVPSRRGWYWVKWLARIEVVALQGPGGVGGVDSFDPEDPHG